MEDEDSAKRKQHAEDASRESDTEPTAEEAASIENERDQIKEFVKSLSFEEIQNGGWFAKLLTVSFGQYTTKIDAAYFQKKQGGSSGLRCGSANKARCSVCVDRGRSDRSGVHRDDL